MKSDIDSLMENNNIDALLVTGPAQHNPPMYYLTGGGHLTHADLIKKRGEEAVLFYNSMERDGAAQTGLATKNLDEYRLFELLKQTNGDVVKARVKRYQKMLADLELTTGRMAIYGEIDAGAAYAIFSGLQQAMPGMTIVGEADNSLLLQAMATKDSDEVERIRRMGQITTQVVGKVAEFLSFHKAKNEVLVKPDGQPLTIAEVKNRIDLWLAERGVENPNGVIFAMGRDAGVPHNSGNPADALRLGQTIIFDIFPCEAGGGYFYDFTRTWCLGYATDESMQLYEDVYSVYQQIMSELQPGEHCPKYQRRACELFEARGHPHILNDPKTQEGYVHSLGHGLGLNVHERPWFGLNASPEDRLDPGSVFTIEPGLYYPERGLGVRLENTVWVRPDGEMEVLAEYPLDLVLPVK
ncbi:MAG: aminopeptidase P family protein [Anaerolineales bacterium]|nr:aminopeptidase P family protein [Anaerolineales bacterium]